MTRRPLHLGALVAAALLLATQASASTGGATLHFLDVSRSATPAFDAGTGEPRPGDRVYLRDELFGWHGAKRGAHAGHVDATLTFMSSFATGSALAEISGQLFVPGGSIRVEGVVRIGGNGPSRFELPVVGGTGRFAGARGVLESRDLAPNGDRSAMDIHLLP